MSYFLAKNNLYWHYTVTKWPQTALAYEYIKDQQYLNMPAWSILIQVPCGCWCSSLGSRSQYLTVANWTDPWYATTAGGRCRRSSTIGSWWSCHSTIVGHHGLSWQPQREYSDHHGQVNWTGLMQINCSVIKTTPHPIQCSSSSKFSDNTTYLYKINHTLLIKENSSDVIILTQYANLANLWVEYKPKNLFITNTIQHIYGT